MIRAVIIDDEVGCVSNLQYYLSKYCPQIDVIATGYSLTAAMNICRNMIFDVAFLDIHLGDGDIFQALKELTHHKFEIVFVTAFENYALKAFKVEALDYILKPLIKKDIIECYNKITKRLSEVHSNEMPPEIPELPKLSLKQGDKVHVIKQDDVYYLKAKGVYTEILFNLNGRQMSLTVCKPIGDLVNDYGLKSFYRVHKSYLVNYRKITQIVRGDVLSLKLENGTLVPVAKRRVHDFLSFFDLNK